MMLTDGETRPIAGRDLTDEQRERVIAQIKRSCASLDFTDEEAGKAFDALVEAGLGFEFFDTFLHQLEAKA